MGRLVQLDPPISVDRAVELIKAHLKLDRVRLATADGGKKEVGSVAICAGSGASLLKNVRADLYLTGEMSHHEVLDAVHGGAHVVLCDHSNTERGFLADWQKTLKNALGDNVEVAISKQDRDPLQIV